MESSTVLRIAFIVPAVAVVVYLGYLGVMYVVQPRIMYMPWRDITETPADHGASYEDVTLETTDGEHLHAWWLEPETPVEPGHRFTILFCHGNAGNLTHRASFAAGMFNAGVNVLAFDYRGYGRSSGKPTEEGTYRDAEAAWRWLVEEKGIPPSDIIVAGTSLGGPVAAWLAVQHTPRALVLESTFTSVAAMVREHYSWLPAGLARYRYPTEEYVRQVTCPVFVMHSPDDTLVPIELGRRIYDAAPGPKLFYVKSGGHNEGFGQPEREGYAERRELFLRFMRDPAGVAAEYDADIVPGE